MTIGNEARRAWQQAIIAGIAEALKRGNIVIVEPRGEHVGIAILHKSTSTSQFRQPDATIGAGERKW